MRLFEKRTERPIVRHLKEGRNFLFLLLFFAALPLLVSSSFIYLYQSNQHLLAQNTPLTLVLFHLAAIPAMAFALTPTTFIAVISGYFFSWYGLAGIVVSYPLAALLGLKFGGAARKVILRRSAAQSADLQSFTERVQRDGFPMIVFARLSPVLPFAMTNVALSALRLNPVPFMAATMIGMFPRTFIFFMLGKDATEIWSFVQSPTFEGVHRLIPLVLIVISSAGLLWVGRRVFKKTPEVEN